MGCASPPPPRVEPLFKDGVRQEPLTLEEAERRVRGAAPEVEACYRREMLNLAEKTSNYLVQVSIPTDASAPSITIVEETIPGQVNLRACLIETLGRVHFPAYVGRPITLNVPVEGPG